MDNNKSELKQTMIRLGVCGGSIVYLTILYFYSGIAFPITMPLFTVWSIILFLWVKNTTTSNNWREFFTVIIDHSAMFALFYSIGEPGIVFILLTPWINIGHGIRFGIRKLFLSCALSISLLICMYGLNTYLYHKPHFLIGLIFLSILVPCYTVFLLKRLHTIQDKFREQAQQLQHLARHDSLTGILNRQAFNDALDAEISQNPKQMALIYFDLDGFKKINDTAGHDKGDVVLRSIAHDVKKIIREHDIFARLGGDEFVILLTQGSVGDACERLCENIIDSAKSIGRNHGFVDLSASVGCVVYNNSTISAKECIEKADNNMYAAKNSGKGKYILTTVNNYANK